jgi:hypothetical protein
MGILVEEIRLQIFFAVITEFQSVFCYENLQSIMLLEDFVCLLFYVIPHIYLWAEIAQSVQRLATGWTVWDQIPVGATFSTPVQICPRAYPASFTMHTGSFPGIERLGHGVSTRPHLVFRLKKE